LDFSQSQTVSPTNKTQLKLHVVSLYHCRSDLFTGGNDAFQQPRSLFHCSSAFLHGRLPTLIVGVRKRRLILALRGTVIAPLSIIKRSGGHCNTCGSSGGTSLARLEDGGDFHQRCAHIGSPS